MSTDQLAALEARVLADHDRLEKSVRVATIAYIILTAVVFAYTSVVVSKLKTMTSPESVAELAAGMVQQHIPEQRERLMAMINERKDDWAKSAVATAHESMPQLENQLQVVIEHVADGFAAEINKRIMPEFVKFVKADAANLHEKYKNATDEELAEVYVGVFVEVIEQELDKYLNDKFIDAVNKLQMEMHELSKPGVTLTKKQDAQRRLLQNWAHLSDRQEFGQAMLTDLLTAVKRKFNAMTAEDFDAVPQSERDLLDEDGNLPGIDPPLPLQ